MSSRPAAAAAAAAAAESIESVAAVDDDTDYQEDRKESITTIAQKWMVEYHHAVQNCGVVPQLRVYRGGPRWHVQWHIAVDVKSVGNTPLECALMHPESSVMLFEVLKGMGLPRDKGQKKAVVAGLSIRAEHELAELALISVEVAELVATAVDADAFNVEGPIADSFNELGYHGFERILRVLGPERIALKCFTAAVRSVRHGNHPFGFVRRVIESIGVWIGIEINFDVMRFACPDHPNVALHPVIAYAVTALPVPESMKRLGWCFESGRLPDGYEFCFNVAFAVLVRANAAPHFRAPETKMKDHPEMLLRRHPNYGVDAVEFMLSPEVAERHRSWHEFTHHASLRRELINGIPPWKIIGWTDEGKACVIKHDPSDRVAATDVALSVTFHVRRALIGARLTTDLMTIILEYIVLPIGVKYHCAWINEMREMALDMLSSARGHSRSKATAPICDPTQHMKPVPGTKRFKRTASPL